MGWMRLATLSFGTLHRLLHISVLYSTIFIASPIFFLFVPSVGAIAGYGVDLTTYS
jgi:hypothetical protein